MTEAAPLSIATPFTAPNSLGAQLACRAGRLRFMWTDLRVRHAAGGSLLAFVLCVSACGEGDAEVCGPGSARVKRVIDGDTIELTSGQKLRLLLVDAPEITNGHDACFGAESRDYLRDLLEGQRVDLSYDSECRDRYDRLLAYVRLAGEEVNSSLVREGYACVLHIPPNGAARSAEFKSLEREARAAERGLWGTCPTKPCG